MSIIQQNSRVSHHKLTNTGLVFTVPPSEDFTDGTWATSGTDLALGEIGINMNDDKIWFRSDNGIIEIATLSGSSLLWTRDGDDIRAVEDAVSTPVVYPNILPALDGNGMMGTIIDAWQELFIRNSEQYLEVSQTIVDGKGAPGFLLRNETSGGHIWIENEIGTNASTIDFASNSFDMNVSSGSGTNGTELFISPTTFDVYDYNLGLMFNLTPGIFRISTDGDTLAESYILGTTTTLTLFSVSELIGTAPVYTFGTRTGSDGTGSFVEGGSSAANEASGTDSHAEGLDTLASGTASHAEGAQTTASGADAHAEGDSTVASGADSHAEGVSTTASANAAHAEGNTTVASGDYSHSEGDNTTASGYGSHSGGVRAVASHYAEWARGVKAESYYGKIQYYDRTTDATPSIMSLDGADNFYFTIASGDVYRFNVQALLVDEATGDSKEYSGSGIIKNVAGTTTLVAGSAIASALGDVSLATAVIAMTANDTNDRLEFTVTGIAATNIKWSVYVDYVKIDY